MKKKAPSKSWHIQQEKILKTWGEASSCYRYMHFMAYQAYKATSMRFTLPIIIISTVTGTANFAQETFPVAWQDYVPLIIGFFNLLAAILTTVLQFLKANELMEAHRVASITFGKLSRYIRLELSLPIYERTVDGMAMIERCRTEYDALIEQSPPVPKKVLDAFDKKFPVAKEDFARPEISDIEAIDLFDAVKEQVNVKNAAGAFKTKLTDALLKRRDSKGPYVPLGKEGETAVLRARNLVQSGGSTLQEELDALRAKSRVSQAGQQSESEGESETTEVVVDQVVAEITEDAAR